MRLNKLRALLKSLPLNDMSLVLRSNTPDGWTFENLENFKKLLAALDEQPFFQKEVTKLASSRLFSTTANVLYVAKKDGPEGIYRVASDLLAQLYGLSLILEKIIADDKPETVSIKLPDPSDFSSLLGDLQMFRQAIEQIILNPTINGELRVIKWETGSFWIGLYLGTAAAVTLVAGVTWSALILCKKYEEFEILWETARS
jgi:hypothetical protein